MKFSVIMPSFLGQYTTAAKDREAKIIRAIESITNQTFTDWELIIIADGCNKTVDIVVDYFKTSQENQRISLYKVPKQRLWGGIRNTGIDKAEGDYIIYCDIDDCFMTGYLEDLNSEMQDNKDWYIVDDLKIIGNEFVVSRCDIDKLGKCGTSNIIHKRSLHARWIATDYGEDWQFIKQLKKLSKDFRKLLAVGYKVCHIPGSGGYDV